MKTFDNAFGVFVWGGLFSLLAALTVSVCFPSIGYVIGVLGMIWGIGCIAGMVFLLVMVVKKDGWPDSGSSG